MNAVTSQAQTLFAGVAFPPAAVQQPPTEPPLDNAFTDLAAFSGSTFTTFTLPMEVFTLPFTTFPLFPPMFQP